MAASVCALTGLLLLPHRRLNSLASGSRTAPVSLLIGGVMSHVTISIRAWRYAGVALRLD